GATGVDRSAHIADVTASGTYAYLAARRLNTTPCGQAGVYVVDIADPTAPREVGFIAFPPESYPGEGMQVVSLNTPSFRGDVLVTNNENCTNPTNPARVGGFSLYDVTDPLNPVPLAVGFGDTNGGTLARANDIHSAFAWQARRHAYVVAVDNPERGTSDTDIFDITDPRNPVMIAEQGLPNWPEVSVAANGETVNLHDMVVKKVRGHYLMLLSYWDAGWIVLDVDDPANPTFVAESDHPDPDLLGFFPEGNAHQAEWSHNNKWILGTDEDFSPFRIRFSITSGPNAGDYGAGQFSWTVPLATKYPGGVVQGPTAWGGSGCVEDVDGNGISDRAEVPPASSLVAAPGEAKTVVFSRGTCFFSIKVESGQLAGYDNVLVAQNHGATVNGTFPNGFACGSQGHVFTVTASGLCIGHRAMHLLFGDDPSYTGPDLADMPPIGTPGARISASSEFDGWGYVHLLDASSLETVDSYAIPEALDPAHATGSGVMSVHEVAMDKSEDLAYVSWYDAGMRVLRFGPGGIEEVGHYIAEGGNDFWGVEAYRAPDSEETLILGSDRDSGLWILRYTGG
ncbi:MAG TPA: hypothetical protein VFO65_00870, partial [Acidimicrobiales bacterium]|nr:hypothetical protein [Acidimicrobiales bacterium]